VRACLDAFALLAWLLQESGWERVREVMDPPGETDGGVCVMSAVKPG